MFIVNDKLNSEAKVFFDSGVSFGMGLFETIRITETGDAIFLKEHLERLNKGLITINIQKSINEAYIFEKIKNHQIKNCILKIIVTEDNTVITTRAYAYTEKIYNDEWQVKISDLKRNSYSHTTYLKSLNYTDNLLERKKALSENYNEVLFLNTKDEIAEGSISNIFFVKDNQIYTPKVECGLLAGIMRAWIINEFNAVEGIYYMEDLQNAEEVFLSNSVFGVMPVNNINKIYMYNSFNTFNNIRIEFEKLTKNYEII